jgi:Fic family protein
MAWNWQHPDWPKFQWDSTKLTRLEALFLEEAGMVGGAAMHLQAAVRDALTVEMLTSGALGTSEID